MTYSHTFKKEMQPADYAFSVGKRIASEHKFRDPERILVDTKNQLRQAAANFLVDNYVIRVDEGNSTLFKMDFMVIPPDDFMGLVIDMAKAMVEQNQLKGGETVELQDQQQQTQALIRGIDV